MILTALATSVALAQYCPVEWTYDREACVCNCTPVVVFPPSGSVVPTNVTFQAVGLQAYWWELDGEQIDTNRVPHTSGVLQFRSFFTPLEALPVGGVVDLWSGAKEERYET